jgi:hypothetical protein
MTRVVVTLAGMGGVGYGLVTGSVPALVVGLIGLGLVVLSCRLGARHGEWRPR